MIYLPNQNAVFLKPKKVGGTSFEIALSKYADNKSIITPITIEDEVKRKELGFRGPQNYHCKPFDFKAVGKREVVSSLYHWRWPMKFYNHMTAEQAKERLGEQAWGASKKISIIRNPFDQLISLYFWINRYQKRKMNIEQFFLENPSLLLQNRPIYYIDGEDAIDVYIRYENLYKDIIKVEENIAGLAGLWEIFSNLKTKSQVRPRKASKEEIFSHYPRLKLLISEIYREEIDRFDFMVP